MATIATRTDQVLASARKDLDAQLKVVRSEIERLQGEERQLTQALSSLDGGPAAASNGADRPRRSSPARGATRSRRASTRKASGRRRPRRGGGKPTAERVEELRGLLVDGPKSRGDLAAALKVSPARVQQLLAELGSSVSSRPDPNHRRSKLWSLDGRANGAGAKRGSGRRGRNGSSARGGRRQGSASK